MAAGGISDGTSNTIGFEEDSGSPWPDPGEQPPGLERSDPDGQDGEPSEADSGALEQVIDLLHPGSGAPGPRAPGPGAEDGTEPVEPNEDSSAADLVPDGEADLAFGSGAAPAGADGEITPAATSAEPSLPDDGPGLGGPAVPTGGDGPAPDDLPDDPLERPGDGDGDSGLLEQVADAVGDLWDDASDLVT